MSSDNKVIIVGGGPTGLFSAYLLLKKGFDVDLYDQSSGVAKKFLIAGNGGLNLTHSENIDNFAKRYTGNEERFKGYLEEFGPKDLRDWCTELGIETFVGSSGRVFPNDMKAGKLLVKWVDALKAYSGFSLYLKYRLVEITKEKELTFEHETGITQVAAKKVILALGGASWKKTGSDGKWKKTLESLGLTIHDFQGMNCGFECKWSSFFKDTVEYSPIKHIQMTFEDKKVKGDLMLTPYGVEGGVIYALSNFIRNKILAEGRAIITIDLIPNLSLERAIKKIEGRPKKTSMSNFLRKSLKLDKSIFILLKELLESKAFEDGDLLAYHLKNLEIELNGMRPLDEAISTSGGLAFCELKDSLEAKTIPGLYFAGEMLDYEAPTGGYLLQACFSSAYRVVKDIASK